MADKYCICKMLKFHTFPQLTGIQRHNNREISLPHVHYENTPKNSILIDAGDSYSNAWKKRVKQAEVESGQKLCRRKNSVLFFELYLGFSDDAELNIKQWAAANVKWLEDTFGKENILACTLHMDEQTPHIHADIIPIDNRNRLCMKSFVDGPNDMRKMQDAYAKAMEPFGLRRGEENSKAKAQTLTKFYKSVNQIEKSSPPQQSPDEFVEDYIDRLHEYIKTMKFALENTKLQAKRTDDIVNTRVSNELYAHKDAIFFQQLLEKKKKDKKKAQERLQTYIRLEQNVPDAELDKILDFLSDRYCKDGDGVDMENIKEKEK